MILNTNYRIRAREIVLINLAILQVRRLGSKEVELFVQSHPC